ncbi:MAG: DegT/DnrJ/EryC1/StrS family aminotransferase [Dehalococcoidia bacterium]|nr:DegT/DnrJ/EryC1/StrS family aminotransferase [Dehalococcoidia bacterium]
MTEIRVPFVDMQARLAPLRDEILAACARVLDSGAFVMGPEAAALEEEFSRFCGVEHGVAVSNGTAALQVALLALGVGPGDEVITVANTFIATVEAISAVGATPVLVDVDPATYLMDPARFEAAVTSRTRAVIPVHLYGLMCDMPAISAIARRRGIRVVEDACQAHGATFGGRVAGSFADAACFSFYPAKNLGTIGEGGMVVTRDAALAARMRSLRSHGETERYHHSEPGWNLRLGEVQAAATRVQLRHLVSWNAGRRRVAHWYGEALAGLPLHLPVAPAQREHVYHLYVVQADGRDRLRAQLAEAGIGTGVHYPVPVHEQPAYASLGLTAADLPVTSAAAARLLSLPMYAEMTRAQVDDVASCVARALEAVPAGSA